MTQIPRPALFLGLAGLIPFLIGALGATGWIRGETLLLGQSQPVFLLLHYGSVILAFMSGVLWGFAIKSEGATGYVLSVLPALWGFFMVRGIPPEAMIYLILGYLGLLGLDWYFWRAGLAPPWWMRLRVLLTTIAILCLSTVLF